MKHIFQLYMTVMIMTILQIDKLFFVVKITT